MIISNVNNVDCTPNRLLLHTLHTTYIYRSKLKDKVWYYVSNEEYRIEKQSFRSFILDWLVVAETSAKGPSSTVTADTLKV